MKYFHQNKKSEKITLESVCQKIFPQQFCLLSQNENIKLAHLNVIVDQVKDPS